MLCKLCCENPADVRVQTVISGEVKEYMLCSKCAQKLGYSNSFEELSFDLSSLFDGIFKKEKNYSKGKRCQGCGLTYNDIISSGKVGCAKCYSFFHDEIIPLVERIHGKKNHVEQKPRTINTAMSDNDLDRLKESLRDAIEKQEFEKAAVIRDKIKEREGK